jgi:hypothetical protein
MEVVSLSTSSKLQRNPFYRSINLKLELCGQTAVGRLAELLQQPDSAPAATVLTADEWVPSC